MKYIRTKDNKILEWSKLTEMEKLDFDLALKEKEIDFIPADTIEELCDDFVVIANYGIGYGANPGTIEKDNIRRFFNSLGEWTVYGAIWIKGKNEEPILKSVAKMKRILPDDKIEWELL